MSLWIWFALGCSVIGAFVLGTMFGIEYQKHRVQRFWKQNNERLRANREGGWPPIPRPLPPPPTNRGSEER